MASRPSDALGRVMTAMSISRLSSIVWTSNDVLDWLTQKGTSTLPYLRYRSAILSPSTAGRASFLLVQPCSNQRDRRMHAEERFPF